MWSLINTVQLLHYFPIMSLYYSQEIYLLNSFLNVANMDNVILQSVFELHFDQEELAFQDAPDYRFNNQEVESRSLLLNSGDLILLFPILLIYLIVLGILKLILWKMDRSSKLFKWAKRKIQDKWQKFLFGVFIVYGFESFLDLSMSALLNIVYGDIENTTQIYSYVLSLCIISSLAFLFICSISLLCCKERKIKVRH